MLPLKLILKGLYSYQEEQTIDFTKLTDARIFGIFGSVGSGKSSILEAISFALYGETERLNLRDNRAYNMMNLKCGELYIDFTFLAGKPETKYRCIASCKRHKTIFEKVPSIERKAYKNINDAWIPIELIEVEQAIGLSYQNFRRTIIIPQGKFSEFLQLGDKDRTEMLKEIFQLERFEYSHKVASLEKKNTEKINLLQGRLDQLGEITEEEIEAKTQERQEILEASEKLNKVLEERINSEKELSHLKELFEKLASLKSDLFNLEKQKEYFERLEENVKHYEHCLIHFKPLLDLKKDSEKKLKNTESEIQELSKRITTARAELLAKEEQFISIEKSFFERDSLKIAQGELEKIIQIVALEEEIKELQGRVLKGTTLIDSLQKNINNTLEQRDKQKQTLLQKKASLPDLGVLKEINNWFVVKGNIEENIQTISAEISELEINLEKTIHPSIRKIPSTVVHFFSDDEREVPPQDFSLILKDKKEEISSYQENLSKEIENVVIQSKLETFASTLKPNHPCPLCGSEHHPNKLNVEDVSFKIGELRTKKQELAESYKKFEELLVSEQARIIKIQNIKDQISKEAKKLESETKKLESHKSNFKWTEYAKVGQEEVELIFLQGQKTLKEIAELEEALDKASYTLEENQKNKEKYIQGLNQLITTVGGKQAQLSTYASQLKQLKLEDFKGNKGTDLRKQIEKLEREYSRITSEYELMNNSIGISKQEIAKMEGKFEETLKFQRELQLSYEKNTELLRATLSSSSFISLDEVEKILSGQIDPQKENKKVQEYKNQVTVIITQLEEVEEETDGKAYDKEAHEKILKTIAEQKSLIVQANKEIGRLDNLLKTLQENLNEKLRMQKEMEELLLRKEDLNVMKQLFKASGFVNYVSSIFLRNLCNAANERFYKLTRQKLRLELTENNNFQIRDFLNNGQVRSVKTLSGGQTFQASLSLALALAESVQQQNKSAQNFFFLDEGFGSLDKESLNIVFETLKSLRKENRIVGIISHVNELQQEIDVYLDVSNTEEQGSLVKGSWES